MAIEERRRLRIVKEVIHLYSLVEGEVMTQVLEKRAFFVCLFFLKEKENVGQKTCSEGQSL